MNILYMIIYKYTVTNSNQMWTNLFQINEIRGYRKKWKTNNNSGLQKLQNNKPIVCINIYTTIFNTIN